MFIYSPLPATPSTALSDSQYQFCANHDPKFYSLDLSPTDPNANEGRTYGGSAEVVGKITRAPSHTQRPM